jgi:glycerol-3-phosphate O-acyltransferase
MSTTLGAMLRSRKRNANAVLATERFQSHLAALAERLQRPLAEVRREAETGMREIASVHNLAFTTMWDRGLGPMHTRAWTIDVDQASLQSLKRLNETNSLVFLPTHRSYADAFILTQTLREAGLPRNYILGGDNLGFFPLGTILRNAGGVLMRRSFQDDEVYKFVVREYLGHLAATGHNLEWYMEGGRSRTGKLRPPKYGLLRYLVDAIESGVADDMLLIPVAMTYDQLHEIGVMAAEEAGAQKAKEGLSWLGRLRAHAEAVDRHRVCPFRRATLAQGGAAPRRQRARRRPLDGREDRFRGVRANQSCDAGDGTALVTLALLGVGDRGPDARRGASPRRAAARLRAPTRPADGAARGPEDGGRIGRRAGRACRLGSRPGVHEGHRAGLRDQSGPALGGRLLPQQRDPLVR